MIKIISIAFSSDEKYVQHLGVTIASILKNLHSEYTPDFYVIDGGISDKSKELIASLKSLRDFNISYLKIDINDFKDCPCHADYISIATYFRIKLPDMLITLDKVLYLDIDMVVDKDISPLWEIALSPQEWLGAVIDPGIEDSFLPSIAMKPGDKYFNAGMLIMNLKALRENNFEQKCFEFINQYNPYLIHVDQDVLNSVCNHHVKWITPHYNLLHGYVRNYHKPVSFAATPYDIQTILDAGNHPVVIHYTGKMKPWFYKCKHPLAYKYMDYIKFTPWKDYSFPDKTLFNIIKRFVSLKKRKITFFLKNI